MHDGPGHIVVRNSVVQGMGVALPVDSVGNHHRRSSAPR